MCGLLWFVMTRKVLWFRCERFSQRFSSLNFVPNFGAFWKGCGPFRRCRLTGGSVSLRWVSCFMDQPHILFTFCFLIADVMWPASCSSLWPQFHSSHHAFLYCCQVFFALANCIDWTISWRTPPPYVTLARCFVTQEKSNRDRQWDVWTCSRVSIWSDQLWHVKWNGMVSNGMVLLAGVLWLHLQADVAVLLVYKNWSKKHQVREKSKL